MSKFKNELLISYKNFVKKNNIYFNYLDKYEYFTNSVLKHTQSLLIEYNATFSFERKGNLREGVFTQKEIKNLINGQSGSIKIIKIRKDTLFISKIHTYFHELVHLINNHNNQELNKIKLSTPQKEYVAEVTSQALIYSFCGGLLIENIPSNKKWDHTIYVKEWIKNAKMTKIKISEMWKQISFSYDLISKTIINNMI